MLIHTAARAPTLGAGRLVCVDGPAGSGKTTLAAAIVAAADGLQPPRIVHMDDLYDGWDGLDRLTDQLDALLTPLSSGRPGGYRRYDWDAGRYAETHVVRPGPLLVLEGVGAGCAAYAGLSTVLVWVEAPPGLRLERGLERDGVQLQERWRRWMHDESVHFELEGTRARADLQVDGSGARPVVVRGSS